MNNEETYDKAKRLVDLIGPDTAHKVFQTEQNLLSRLLLAQKSRQKFLEGRRDTDKIVN